MRTRLFKWCIKIVLYQIEARFSCIASSLQVPQYQRTLKQQSHALVPHSISNLDVSTAEHLRIHTEIWPVLRKVFGEQDRQVAVLFPGDKINVDAVAPHLCVHVIACVRVLA
jgi:hypothetical protein